MSKEPLNIVILGGSFAGLSAAHHFLRRTIEELGITRTAPKYRIVLVSPSTHLFWNIGAPRAIVSPTLIPHSKSFLSILEAFREYPKNRFTFIYGNAISVDFKQRIVTISVSSATIQGYKNARLSSGTRESESSRQSTHSTKTISYHALIIATGTSADSPLLSLHGRHEETIAALNTFHCRLRDATSIIIAGGGSSGVECAGQLATFLNGCPRKHAPQPASKSPANKSFPSLKSKLKDKLLSLLKRHKRDRSNSTASTATNPEGRRVITLISGNDRLLPRLPQAVSAKAEKKLKKLGVNIMHDLRLLSAQELPSGSTRCVLSDELTISCDLFVAATGVYPNTQFLPPELLDASGYVSSDAQCLRVSRAGERVYAIGDCASWSKNNILDCYDSISTLQHNLKNDLLAYELKTQYPFGGAEDQLDALEDWTYVQNPKITQLVPISRFGGVGVLFGYSIPGLLVWLMKGRDYRVGKAKLATEAGHNPYAPDTYIYK